jgi:NAD(P)-dependent dehydrogenase (short-subunit alcohol dehydrogenase family)
VSSVHAEATSAGIATYAASKGGLLALTRAMALEWAEDGIRANCVLPGAVDTPMLAEGLFRSGSTVQSLGRKHPLGRVGHSSEIAHTIAYLLSDDASFVTGASLRVDGGALARLSTE